MIGLSVKGADKTIANLKGARAGIPVAQDRGVRRGVTIVERALKLEMNKKGQMDAFWGKKGDPGNGLATRTGRTHASITGNAFRVGERVVGVVGSKEQHLKLHEDGAVVKGTSPKGYARIPTAAAQTGAGVDRNAGRSIRDIPGAFLFQSKAGKLWAAVRSGKSALQLLYLLVKSVTLKPRAIFARVRTQQTPSVVEAMRSEVTLVVNKANT